MGALPPSVSSYKDRTGKTRYRLRKKGMTYSLPGEPGEERFEKALAAARAGHRRLSRHASIAPNTLRAAWVEVRRSIDFQSMKTSSQRQQIAVAERFLQAPIAENSKKTFGDMAFTGIRRGDVKKILARYASHPHAGRHVLHLLRKLSLVALDLEWITNDPTYRVRFRPKLIGHRAWTDAEMVQFETRWPMGTKERLGYALALYTGQRRSDVAPMSWIALNAAGIAVKQEKTGAPLLIPIHPELDKVLSVTPRRGETILVTFHGKPFTVCGFGNMMAEAIGLAGLPDACRLHGLRKSAGRCLAEAGATTRQIMAVLGHKSLSEAEHYTREVEQKHLAQQAMDTWARPKLLVVPGGK
jgi:integrase